MFNIDGFVKSQFRLLSDHLGAFQTVLLNFKNPSQAPQTVTASIPTDPVMLGT